MMACKLIGKLFPTMKSLGGSEVKKGQEKAAGKEVEASKEVIDFSKVKIEPLFSDMVDFESTPLSRSYSVHLSFFKFFSDFVFFKSSSGCYSFP